MTPIRESLADLIRSSGRTQGEIARAAGLSQPMLSAILTGQRSALSAETVGRLGRVLGLSPAAIGRLVYDSLPERLEKISGKKHGSD